MRGPDPPTVVHDILGSCSLLFLGISLNRLLYMIGPARTYICPAVRAGGLTKMHLRVVKR